MARILRRGCTCLHSWGIKIGGVWHGGGNILKVKDDCKYHAGMSPWAADEFDTIEA